MTPLRVNKICKQLHRQEIRQHLGLDAQPDARHLRVQRFQGELERRKRESYVLKRFLQRKRIKHTVVDIFYQIFSLLKEKNKEKWAARIIINWWRKIQLRLRQIEAERWLPLDINPDTADFTDVDRVLKVLDVYALGKLAKLQN